MVLSVKSLFKLIRLELYRAIANFRGARIDEGSLIHFTVQVDRGLRVGASSYIGPYSNFRGDISIGKFFLCADNVHVVGGDHKFDVVGLPMVMAGRDFVKYNLKTVIGDDVWIGRGVTIMRGVKIGNGCIIGAGSIVTSDLESGYIYVGCPARKLRSRFSEDDMKLHFNLLSELEL